MKRADSHYLPIIWVKGQVKLLLCLTKYHTMKTSCT